MLLVLENVPLLLAAFQSPKLLRRASLFCDFSPSPSGDATFNPYQDRGCEIQQKK